MSKSDPLRVADYLAHIVEAIDRIHRYVEDMAEPSPVCPSSPRRALGADVTAQLKRVKFDAEEAELNVRLKSLQTEL